MFIDQKGGWAKNECWILKLWIFWAKAILNYWTKQLEIRQIIVFLSSRFPFGTPVVFTRPRRQMPNIKYNFLKNSKLYNPRHENLNTNSSSLTGYSFTKKQIYVHNIGLRNTTCIFYYRFKFCWFMGLNNKSSGIRGVGCVVTIKIRFLKEKGEKLREHRVFRRLQTSRHECCTMSVWHQSFPAC